MSEQGFDAFIRQTAADSSRRSLLSLGTAAAALAALADPAVTAAKKGGRRRKGKKKNANKQCQQQVEQCEEYFEDACQASGCEPEDLEVVLECCEFLAECEFTEFGTCLQPK